MHRPSALKVTDKNIGESFLVYCYEPPKYSLNLRQGTLYTVTVVKGIFNGKPYVVGMGDEGREFTVYPYRFSTHYRKM